MSRSGTESSKRAALHVNQHHLPNALIKVPIKALFTLSLHQALVRFFTEGFENIVLKYLDPK
jgi:hypothetical protein